MPDAIFLSNKELPMPFPTKNDCLPSTLLKTSSSVFSPQLVHQPELFGLCAEIKQPIGNLVNILFVQVAVFCNLAYKIIPYIVERLLEYGFFFLSHFPIRASQVLVFAGNHPLVCHIIPLQQSGKLKVRRNNSN